jgi:hypothetical protein
VVYHFEAGAWIGDYWGMVDGFLTGLAAVAAACVAGWTINHKRYYSSTGMPF